MPRRTTGDPKTSNARINRQTIRLYWQQIRRYKISFFAMLVCIPLSSLLLDTVLPYVLSQAVDTFTSRDAETLWQLLGLAGIVASVGVALNFTGFQSYITHESKVRANLAISTLDTLLKKDAGFFANQKIGALTGRFIDFVNAHVGLQDLLIIRTLTFAFNMVVGTVLIFISTPAIGLLVLALIAGLLIQVRLSLKLRANFRNERKELIGVVNGMAADTISNNATVKTFANESYELTQNRIVNEKYRDVYRKDFRWMTAEGSMRLLTMSAVQIIAIGMMANMLIAGQIELGIAIFTVAYLQRIASQLFVLGEMVNGYDRLFLQAAPMTEMLIADEKITDAPNSQQLTVRNPSIKLHDVSYAYDDAKDITVLDSISLTIPAGQRVGLVGPSGAGKTTVTKLLMRLDDTTGGIITIDGQDISQVTQESLRHAISFVPQEPLLFHRSLRENILYGKLDANDEELARAIKAARADEFIDHLPRGLDTVVGERGVKLSGGQRQRIAIARAILKDAPILILDEATSALDSESEKLIQASLDTLMKGRTSIVIAHRLSTIAKLDRIIVLENGTIVEDGSHTALLKQNGTYAKLWRHQSGGFIDE
jgi:ATP-binding cassette subfamily B protein